MYLYDLMNHIQNKIALSADIYYGILIGIIELWPNLIKLDWILPERLVV
jgi:hypothetical protein